MDRKIHLNDLLHLQDISNTKIRFNVPSGGDWNPIELFKERNFEKLLRGHYWNATSKKSYRVGQTTVGFIRLNKDDLWLLFHVGRVTTDLETFGGVGYEFEPLTQYEKYFGRLIVKYKNRTQNLIRKANSVLEDCEVSQILPDIFDNDIFPGYDQINISWQEMRRVLAKDGWRAALMNQKGVYLITDVSTGKMYVGSAYGENMLLGRWESYIRSGHGGNVELKALGFPYIKENFQYSILEIFKSTTSDDTIFERENWWKRVLKTRDFGFNKN